jgi:hypothetical protein
MEGQMEPRNQTHCTAFEGVRRIASGAPAEVAAGAKAAYDRGSQVLVFDDETGEQVEPDYRGTVEDVLARLTPPEAARGPGRPKLGVVAREVTLLPRHWDWLNGQPGGASVALRKLVEAAARGEPDRLRRGREVSYRFISAMAGDLPAFEEATRALFAGDGDRFRELIQDWPEDIRDHAQQLAGPTFRQG